LPLAIVSYQNHPFLMKIVGICKRARKCYG
jgi:hypothetical protein